MADFASNCPHCGTKNVSFEVDAEFTFNSAGRSITHMTAVCGICFHCVIFEFESENDTQSITNLLDEGAEIFPIRTFPDMRPSHAPRHTPSDVAECYREAMDNFPDNPRSSGGMFRVTVEIAMKMAFPDINTRWDLKKRIDKAVEENLITRSMGEWSHRVRFGGAESLHGDPLSKEELTDLQAFTELLLKYLFELPGMMNEAKSRKRQDSLSGDQTIG